MTGFEDYRGRPPNIVLWSKDGVDEATFYKDSGECITRQRAIRHKSYEDGLAVEESCFLEKGYCFTNVQKRSLWRNYCSDSDYGNKSGPACQSQGKRLCPPAIYTPEEYEKKYYGKTNDFTGGVSTSSTSSDDRLRVQTQNTSNVQMNQILQRVGK